MIALIVLGFAFYWFQFRPAQIKEACWGKIEKIKSGEIKSDKFDSEEFRIRNGIQETINNFYINCLREKGLK